MCGIFGLACRDGFSLDLKTTKASVDTLFRLSESRGKEASGLALLFSDVISVYKQPIAASEMIRTRDYGLFLEDALKNRVEKDNAPHFQSIIGHSRLVTNGLENIHQNNQPVVANNIVLVHNGIIVNDEELWQMMPEIPRTAQVDTEVMAALIRKFLIETESLVHAVQRAFELIRGNTSIAAMFNDINCLLLATNNGSLYYFLDKDRNILAFASERYILNRFLAQRRFSMVFRESQIVRIAPSSGLLINLDDLCINSFSMNMPYRAKIDRTPLTRKIQDVMPVSSNGVSNWKVNYQSIEGSFIRECERLLAANEEEIKRLRRCRKCILPETMPFITYDADGICNYCHNYRSHQLKGEKEIHALADELRSNSSSLNCLVGISGGRDSCYALHYAKTVLGLNPIAFTYDWGMVTDLARRNISRLCGKLGVEHILVSADIRKKRHFIKKNVEAWLRKPVLGLIPLFMAGDKHYFYYASILKRHNGLKLTILGENLLERTDFKVGFAGIEANVVDDDRVYMISIKNQAKLLLYYGKEYLMNPAYFNRSLIDTLAAFCAYYLIERDYLNLFRYIRWDEEKIISTLRTEYDWETATDTQSTWRIGDGTAAFYNYIYYTVAGFSENDTFRSNQIREGKIQRERALELANQENAPRYESIKWYCETINIDMQTALSRINSIPRLYKSSR